MINNEKIIEKLFEKGLIHTKSQGIEIMFTLIETAKEALKNREDFKLNGIGTLRTIRSKARTALNPTTLQPVLIPERLKVKFIQSKAIKDFINGKLD